MSDNMIFNGVDGRTGRYLPSPTTEEEFVRLIRDEPLNPEQLLQYRWWTLGFGLDDKERAPAQDVDPLSLASAGWGVIFAPGITPEIEADLEPLLKRRRQQAGSYFKTYRVQRNPTKEGFLFDNHAGQGPADPNNVPYYLLIVGSPEEIPFSFQNHLDVQYAVGRIYFDDEEAYGAYARNVVETEEAAEKGGDGLPAKKAVFFAVSRKGDRATQRAAVELIRPLVKKLAIGRPGWPRQLVCGPKSTKEQLSRYLGGGETPSILLTTSHGLGFDSNDELQRQCQGALLCRDWQGEDHEVLPQHYFSGKDLATGVNLRGLIAFHFACYSGGTPDVNNFAVPSLSKPQPIAPVPFVSNLAQRLLGHPQGALAVIGHIDRAWTTSFSWSRQGQVEVFENTFKRLMDGHPIGSAMEYFNQRYAELAVAYADLCEARDSLLPVDKGRFARVYRGNNDMRNFVVLGDPAVRAVFRTSE